MKTGEERAVSSVRKCATPLVTALLLVTAGCGGGGDGGGSSSCSPAPAITSSPETTATAGAQYSYWASSRIACIPFFTCGGIELLQGPSGAGVDPIRQVVYWTPAPEDSRKSVAFAIATSKDLCGKQATQAWTVTVMPVSSIHSFQASNQFVLAGETVNVTAIFDGTGSIRGVGTVASGVPVTIGPINVETTITLDVQSPYGDHWSQSITVQLLAPPVITRFKAEPTSIGINAASTLNWWVDGQVDTVRIEPLGTNVAWNSAMSVFPRATTTYTLVATNRAGSVSANVEVVVLPPSTITEFSATAASVNVGGTVTLAAKFTGTGEILKENDLGGMDQFALLQSGDAVSSGPLRRNTRFTLRVTGGTTVTQDLSVAVTGPGTFESVSQTDFPVQDAMLLTDGRVFIASQQRAYYFDPTTKQLAPGPALTGFLVRYLAPLANDRVMTVSPPVDIGCSLAQIYRLTNNSNEGYQCVDGTPVQAMALQDGRVLVRSEARRSGQTAGITLYDPMTGFFGPLTGPSELAGTRGVMLADGRVLFVRPFTGSQLFTPSSNTFSSSNAPFTPRGTGYTRVLLQDGRIFINGGNAWNRAELYDPATDTVSLADMQDVPSYDGQAAAVLASGKVLVAGGSGYATTFLFDPATRTFSRTGGLQAPRRSAIAVRLQDDRVLVLGGCSVTPCPIEIYAP